MRVLFVGDVVRAESVAWLGGPRPMNGFGMTDQTVDLLLGAGVDVITGGNHSWDGPHADRLLAHPQIVRPANVEESIGQGCSP